ncbi:MAG: VWA domain-containing protein [Actinomycetota bacterium]|nr:VWA domain-containing protein [Actinomycetota bacterium]
MSFLAGQRLWLLLAVAGLAACYVFLQFRRRAYAVRFTNLALLESVAPRRPGWRRHLPAAAFLLMLASLVTAFARPTGVVKVPRERATVVVAIDTSISMMATDVEPTRHAAAKDAADRFVDRLPDRFNVGLVSFSGVAQVLVPPTREHSDVRRAIGGLTLGPRTAIGEGIFASLDSLAAAPEGGGGEPPPARIVLLSDGETTTGRTNAEASEAARAAGVPVSTIAFGTDSGAVNVGERLIRVPANRPALREIADHTGGSFFEAASGEELGEVYEDIRSSVGFAEERREVGSWFVGLGLVLAAAAAAGSLLWSSRLP